MNQCLSFAVKLASLAVVTGLCQASTIYTVTLDTSTLVGNSNGPFALDFQLTSGDPASGVVNSASLSLFLFGAGGSAGAGSPFANSGNASGGLGSTISLDTSGGSFFNEFSQYFTPGALLTFQLDLTNNPQSATPDEFTFQLIDKTLGEVPTTDPSGSNSLVVIDLTGSALQPQIYAANGDGVTATPQLSQAGSTTPEPSSIWLCSLGLLGSMLFRFGNRLRSGRIGSSDCACRKPRNR